jgi:superfamily II DNA helicase RecQ
MFLNRLQATRQLNQIRKQMQQLGSLVATATQMVLLKVTLLPSKKNELFCQMHLKPDQVKIFRALTARTNIAYSVVKIGKKDKKQEVEATVLRTVRQKMRKDQADKVVVYGNSVAKVKALAEKLHCQAYHYHAVGKASMLEAFIAGRQRVIVATSALGMGVDIPDIWCVIHFSWPFSLLDYAQESGRAGRDRKRSEAIMIVQEGYQRAAKDKQGEAEQVCVRSYVEGAGGCRRAVLDGYLDRREIERTGCKAGEERCDVCRAAEEEEEEEEEGEEASDQEASDQEPIDARENEGEDGRRTFERQQRERQGPRQAFIQQRQQKFADLEWLRRQLA